MARPTDPEKLAALRARQAANSRAYRARKAAQRNAAPETPGTTPKPRAPRQAPSTEAAVIAAHEQRAAARRRRNEVVGGLTSARNPAVNIYTPREIPTAPASIPDTAPRRRQRIKVLRENTNAQKLQNIGRNRKAYVKGVLERDPRGQSIIENLDADQLRRFREATKRISGVSQQTIAIYFQYEGGEGDFQSALQQIAYPGRDGADIEDALGSIEALAERIERGESLYGPRALGRRLNI